MHPLDFGLPLPNAANQPIRFFEPAGFALLYFIN